MKFLNVVSSVTAEADANIWGKIVDYIGNIMAVKYYASNAYERRVLQQAQKEYVSKADERGYYMLKSYFNIGLVFWCYIAICLCFLIYLYLNNGITPGDFAFVFSINYNIVDQLFTPLIH